MSTLDAFGHRHQASIWIVSPRRTSWSSFWGEKSSCGVVKSLFKTSNPKTQNGPSSQLTEATSCVERSFAMIKVEELHNFSSYQTLIMDTNKWSTKLQWRSWKSWRSWASMSVKLLTLTSVWVAELRKTRIQIGTLVVMMWRILHLVTTSMCGNPDFPHITCMRCWDSGFSRLAVTALPLSVSRNMTFLTRSWVTADTGLPGDFLGTSWGLHRFLPALPVKESVPKKYERKVKPEAFSSTGTSDC